METATVVIEHEFDKALLEQIDTLRTIRLNLAETMLANVQQTTMELRERGLAVDVDADELRSELKARIATLRQRLQRPDVIFADEIDTYADLIDDDADLSVDLADADLGSDPNVEA